MYSYGPPHMAEQKQDDQLEITYSSYVRTQDVTLKTCQRWWMIGRSGERGSGISVLAARHDDYDDDQNLVYFSFNKNLPCSHSEQNPVSSIKNKNASSFHFDQNSTLSFFGQSLAPILPDQSLSLLLFDQNSGLITLHSKSGLIDTSIKIRQHQL